MKIHDTGDAVRMRASFTNEAGTATNPTTVVLTVARPDGTTFQPTLANPAIGTFEAIEVLDQPGLWRFKFAASGGVTAVEAGAMYARPVVPA
ncbi:MAG: hypothetical protein M3P53_02380 [Actinomycetota bacterium]|nr:hypothetical protein [Actinomycetota bacterium]